MKPYPKSTFTPTKLCLVILFFTAFFYQSATAQNATIKEEKLNMKTYMFSDPSSIPQIGRLYPYFRFDGYTDEGVDKEWNMVVLENDYIKVFVCPDIGGKVWGAIEKSTGNEFLYFNHSVKFRDVAMRGAWTSGGLEYNFGDIGHIPTCATPVDYRIKENDDGSVSCIVGALDLPSRTNWNVEISLDKDKAYFETKATWFNNTAVPVTYYHWMNAAAKSNGNLEFLYPGNKRIGHGGELNDWPIDGGKEINFYEKNNFGRYKSYHIINSYSDYFGGYYHDDNFGFGRHSTYDDKPGRKIWIWGLSDQGMIWEDLLTDSDGQYVEYQSGKLFNQAANSSTFTPYKHREFSPHDSDEMKEYWFPIKETGGMVAASTYGVLNVKRSGSKVNLYISPLQKINDELLVKSGQEVLLKTTVNQNPLELFTASFELNEKENFEVFLGGYKLHYNSDLNTQIVERPENPNKDFNWDSAYGLYIQALELEKQRRYSKALDIYKKSYEIEPGFAPTLNRLALANYRNGQYENALKYVNLSLAIDTYDGLANYVMGLIQTQRNIMATAKSGFAIASQSTAYKSASYTQLAKIYLKENNIIKAKLYAEKAINFNGSNLEALEILALIQRKNGNIQEANLLLKKIAAADASSHFINAEKIFLEQEKGTFLQTQITNELPFESYLELALKYKSFGFDEEAIKILELAPENPIVFLWLASLDTKNERSYLEKSLAMSAEMVFPHRMETKEILQSFIEKNNNWKLKYYLSLIDWNKGLIQEAKELIQSCGDEPKMVTFYLTKAKIFSKDKSIVESSLNSAFQLDKNDWRVNMAKIDWLMQKNDFEAAGKIAKKYMKKYPKNARFGMYYAKSLMGMKQYDKCISFLNNFKVLPYEGATEGRSIYHEACVQAAIASLKNKKYKNALYYGEKGKLWPRNLGVGRPYDVDERMDNYIIATALEKLGKSSEASEMYLEIGNNKTSSDRNEGSKLLLQLLALNKNNQDNRAQDILNDHLNNKNQNIYLKWVEAKYKGQNADEIEHKILNKDTTIQDYDTKFVDGEFELVNEFIGVLENIK